MRPTVRLSSVACVYYFPSLINKSFLHVLELNYLINLPKSSLVSGLGGGMNLQVKFNFWTYWYLSAFMYHVSILDRKFQSCHKGLGKQKV